MPDFYQSHELVNALRYASQCLSARKDEVNRLNVFPVPDGDTGTNMSLTLEMVVDTVSKLPANATPAEIRKAATTGSLMGARGNSGVITSQIIRGLCEGMGDTQELTTASLDAAFARAVEVAFAAVRKPVEGTILTVVKDCAAATKKARKKKLSTDEALEFLVNEAFASVQRTPELLPVLKENGVVDAGGFGLALLIDGFVASLLGRETEAPAIQGTTQDQTPKVEIELINDWEGSAYRYCTEFLVFSETLDAEEGLNFLSTQGDCELLVGSNPNFKVHVHTNEPDKVLAYMLERGQISEVHIHNMQLQSEDRLHKLEEEAQTEHKPLGIVAVAPGSGNAQILKSLGVDTIISGGQTMNPSTKEILEAITALNCDQVLVLPNNKNIILAAQSACQLADKPCAVVPTTSIPQAFSALFAFSSDADLKENLEEMTDALSQVKTGEVTHAIKDSKDAHGNPIKDGDLIGIADGSIEVVGNHLNDLVCDLLKAMDAEDADTLTLLAGEDLAQEDFEELERIIEERFEDLEIESHRGEQALYPLIFSLE